MDFSEKLNFTKTNVVIFKTGRKCTYIRIKFFGEALKRAIKPVQGVYKRYQATLNGKPNYRKIRKPSLNNQDGEGLDTYNSTDSTRLWGLGPTTVWWDLKKSSDGKVNSKGDKRNHWKVGVRKKYNGQIYP